MTTKSNHEAGNSAAEPVELRTGPLLRHRSTLTWLLLGLFVVGALGSVWSLHEREQKLFRDYPLQGTALQSMAVQEFRRLYADEVVARAQQLGIEATHDYLDKERAIPLPATLTIQLGERLNAMRPGAQIRLYSEYPFPWRKDGGPRDEFEREALAVLRSQPDESFYRFEEFEGRPSLRYAVADRLRPSCVDCHNQHPQSPKRDWQVGDVRGVLETIRPLDAEVAAGQLARQRGLVVTSAMASLGLVGLGYMYFDYRRTQRAAVMLADRARKLRGSEAELQREKEVAESASRAKSAFLANMSHEIRTPLTAIMGYCDTLLEPNVSTFDRHDALHVVRRNAGHLLELVSDILDISKIEAGKMAVERISTDVAQVTSEVVSATRTAAASKGIGFRLTFAASIPRTIQSDPLRLRQVLLNLLGNAVKFTDSGEVQLHVSSEVREELIYMTFTVRDTGIGMTEEEIERVFQPFTQADESTSRRFGGTGLGLTISRRLSELLRGELTVESSPGGGSEFRLTIEGGPCEGAEMLHGLTEAILQSTSAVPTSQEIVLRGRILLVEDGLDNRLLIARHLRRAGGTVTTAENGLMALELVQAERFDVILMDMQMPEMDGYSATSELRRRGCTIPIIALTAHAMSDDRNKCLAAGCTDYLAKPIPRSTLLSTVARYLPEAVAGEGPIEEPAASSAATGPETALRSSLAFDPEMKEPIQEFVHMLPARVSAIRVMSRVDDLVGLQHILHQLEGAGSGYGFAELTRLAGHSERTIRRREPIETMRAGVDAVVAFIRRIEGYNPKLETIDVEENPRN